MALLKACVCPGLVLTRSQFCIPRRGAVYRKPRSPANRKFGGLRSIPAHAAPSRSEPTGPSKNDTPLSTAAGSSDPKNRPPAPQLATACGLAAAACLSMAYMAGRAVAAPAAAPPPALQTAVNQQQNSQTLNKPFFARTSGSEPIGGRAWVEYKFLQLFSLPTYGKLLAVMAIVLPVLTLGSALYHAAVNCSWSEAVTRSYQVLNNCPGNQGVGSCMQCLNSG
jgi:hypothetical protein